jgi:hypothetical protein
VRAHVAPEQDADEVVVPAGSKQPRCAPGESLCGDEQAPRYARHIGQLKQILENGIGGDPGQHVKGIAPDVR